jgi:hypothetical protein
MSPPVGLQHLVYIPSNAEDDRETQAFRVMEKIRAEAPADELGDAAVPQLPNPLKRIRGVHQQFLGRGAGFSAVRDQQEA